MNSINASISRFGVYAPVLLRVVVGALFLYHGIDKFNVGISNVEGAFEGWGVPAPGVTAPLTAFVEIVGGLLLIAGLGTRIAALTLAGVIVGAIAFVAIDAPVLSGAEGVGSELDFIYLVSLVAIALLGPGTLAADSALKFDQNLALAEASSEA